jgi:putative peptidoglycan lipid II flippase
MPHKNTISPHEDMPSRAAPQHAELRSTRALVRRSALISGMALASRLLGLVRDVGMAWLLGGVAAEALIIAIRLPHMVRRLFAEGALSLSVTAVLTQHNHPVLLTKSIIQQLCLGVLPLALLAWLAATPLMSLLAPASTAAVQEQAAYLFRICLPYTVFVLLATPCMALLHSRQHFFAPAFAPVLFNVCLIAFTLAAACGMGQPAPMLAAGMACGGALQWLSQYCAARSLVAGGKGEQSPPAPREENPTTQHGTQSFTGTAATCAEKTHSNNAPLFIHDTASAHSQSAPTKTMLCQQARKLVAAMPAGVLGAAAPQVLMLCAMAAASALPAGAVAGLYYAERLLELPLGILSTGLGIASLPALAQAAAQGKMNFFAEHSSTALRFALLLTLPAAAGLTAVAETLITVLLGHGAFDHSACLTTTAALWGYVPALPACAINRVLLAGCNACGHTRFTAVSTLFVSLLGLVAGLLCVCYSSNPLWLTLCISLALWLQSLLLWRKVQQHLHQQGQSLHLPWHRLWPLFAAALATGGSAWLCLVLSAELAPAISLCLAVPCGMLCCALALGLFRNKDFYSLLHALRSTKEDNAGKTQS